MMGAKAPQPVPPGAIKPPPPPAPPPKQGTVMTKEPRPSPDPSTKPSPNPALPAKGLDDQGHVRVELTSNGIQWEIKARTPEQFSAMFVRLKNEFLALGLAFKE